MATQWLTWNQEKFVGVPVRRQLLPCFRQVEIYRISEDPALKAKKKLSTENFQGRISQIIYLKLSFSAVTFVRLVFFLSVLSPRVGFFSFELRSVELTKEETEGAVSHSMAMGGEPRWIWIWHNEYMDRWIWIFSYVFQTALKLFFLPHISISIFTYRCKYENDMPSAFAVDIIRASGA